MALQHAVKSYIYVQSAPHLPQNYITAAASINIFKGKVHSIHAIRGSPTQLPMLPARVATYIILHAASLDFLVSGFISRRDESRIEILTSKEHKTSQLCNRPVPSGLYRKRMINYTFRVFLLAMGAGCWFEWFHRMASKEEDRVDSARLALNSILVTIRKVSTYGNDSQHDTLNE